MGYEDMDWIKMTQDNILWQDLVNIIINLMSSKKSSEFLDELGEHELISKDYDSWNCQSKCLSLSRAGT
jgi:hypothetical protein